jgi:hypothetical protein
VLVSKIDRRDDVVQDREFCRVVQALADACDALIDSQARLVSCGIRQE